MPDKHLLLIRPKPQSLAFLTALQERAKTDFSTIISPILEIKAVPVQQEALDAQFLLFTSVNGVETWAAHSSDRSTPALCVGDTTANAALSHGFTAHSANGNASDLLALTQSKANKTKGPIYHISGAKTAVDLASELTKLGFCARRIVSYQSVHKPLSTAAKTCLHTQSVIVTIFSPQSAEVFLAQTADSFLKDTYFVCISANAAEPLQKTPNTIVIAEKPTRTAMLDAIIGLS